MCHRLLWHVVEQNEAVLLSLRRHLDQQRSRTLTTTFRQHPAVMERPTIMPTGLSQLPQPTTGSTTMTLQQSMQAVHPQLAMITQWIFPMIVYSMMRCGTHPVRMSLLFHNIIQHLKLSRSLIARGRQSLLLWQPSIGIAAWRWWRTRYTMHPSRNRTMKLSMWTQHFMAAIYLLPAKHCSSLTCCTSSWYNWLMRWTSVAQPS